MSENTTPKETSWITLPKIVGGLAVTITAVLGLIFLVFPNIRPVPTQPTPTPPPPATMAGKLSNIALTYNVTCQQYTNAYHSSSASQCANPNEMGIEVRYRVELLGLLGKACPVKAFLVNASTNQMIGNTNEEDFTPEAADDTADTVIWLSISNIASGTYHVDLVLYNQNQVELDAMNSIDFKVTSG